jgi:mannonate dehydratase
MKLGSQRRANDDLMLQYLARHGVEGVCGYPELTEARTWRLDEVQALRERVEKHGMTLDLCSFRLTSSGIENQVYPNILLGKDPERDRDIDAICEIIRTASEAGVPGLKYNMALHPVLRTGRTEGRGGARYSSWDFSTATDKDKIHAVAGRVPPELFWERIAYFLERVIPVAEEYQVRMACHPHDPGVPPEGYQGIYRVLGDIEGLKRFADIVDSPYHGFNFCLGTVSEMLQDPARELPDVIRYFGARKKLFNIHFRNIQGKRDAFMETYLDNGDVNMVEIMRVLKEVDYPYLVMPDHVPVHDDDPGSLQAFAHAFGYIKALLQAV